MKHICLTFVNTQHIPSHVTQAVGRREREGEREEEKKKKMRGISWLGEILWSVKYYFLLHSFIS